MQIYKSYAQPANRYPYLHNTSAYLSVTLTLKASPKAISRNLTATAGIFHQALY